MIIIIIITIKIITITIIVIIIIVIIIRRTPGAGRVRSEASKLLSFLAS